jgi:putative FmdB family regulatory protein
MPTYEYVCPHCGHEFEVVQKMTDEPLRNCPKCGKNVKRKVGKGAGIIFKGSGFYATDYRSPDYKAKANAEKGQAPGKSGGSKGGKDGGGAGSGSGESGAGGGTASGGSGGSSAPTPGTGDSQGSGGTKSA